MSENMLQVEIWADVVCPWCRIGRANFDAALSQFEHAESVEVIWRSFELDPQSPRERSTTVVEELSAKYGRTREEVMAMLDVVTDRGAEIGLEFRLAQAKSANTLDAHRILHLARRYGLQDEVMQGLYVAHFVDGDCLGSADTLIEVAVAAGLPEADVRRVLTTDELVAEVREDENVAAQLGISSVPCFVFNRKSGVAGAQPPEHLLAAMREAWGS